MQSNQKGLFTLKLKQARTKDAGTYTCRAYNQGGSVKCTASLVVKSMLKGTNETKSISSIKALLSK